MDHEALQEGNETMTLYSLKNQKAVSFMEMLKYGDLCDNVALKKFYVGPNKKVIFAISDERILNPWIRVFSPTTGEMPTEYRLGDIERKYKQIEINEARELWNETIEISKKEEGREEYEREVYLIYGYIMPFLRTIIEQSDFGDSIHICEVRFSDESIIGLRVSSWNV